MLHVDVAEWSDLLLRVMRDSCLLMHETRLSAGSRLPVCFQVDHIVEPDVLNTSESSQDRLCRTAAKCDTHWELLSVDTSPRVIASQISSARVINTLKIIHNVKVVAEQVSQQEPAGTDPTDLQLPRGAAGKSNADDRAIDTTIDSTSNTFDRHEKFVASDSISWRQGKFSWFEMVLLDCSAINQQTTL